MAAVSAFLNTSGGEIILGLEDNDGRASSFSKGVSPKELTRDQLQSKICSQIQPAVSDLVSVFSVNLPCGGDEAKNAFVIKVREGITAYQSADKLYYSRRAGETIAVEDKDIRLRMLAGDKPRILAALQFNAPPVSSDPIDELSWSLILRNIGVRTIGRAVVRVEIRSQGLSHSGSGHIMARTRDRQFVKFSLGPHEENGLLPGEKYTVRAIIRVPREAFRWKKGPPKLNANITVFIDDGLPTEIPDYDLMADLTPTTSNLWEVSDPIENPIGDA